MSGTSIVGSGFDMPYDLLLRKQEVTGIYEDPDDVENFHRSTLKDMRPLPALFESDQPRGGTDTSGRSVGNNISERFLSFRDSGFQSHQNAEPYLPDGTFLDWQGLEKDSRGVALEPNMRKHVDQQMARSSLINYKNDDDPSIMESGVNPWDMNRNIRQGQNVFKDYYKNFDTSWDSMGSRGAVTDFSKSRIPTVNQSADMNDPLQLPNRNVMNITNSLSNDTSIGFRRTTDHMFKVSQYGKTNQSSFTNEDWYKNRSSSHIDHDIMVSWQDVNVSKSTALKMIDLSKQKSNLHFNGVTGINWEDSKSARGTKQKLTSVDMAGMNYRPAIETQPTSAHTKLDGEIIPKAGEHLLKRDDQVINKTKIHTTIFEKMGLINKDFTKRQKDDLRNSIKQTAKNKSLFISESNKKQRNIDTDKNKLLWDSESLYKKGSEKTIMNYKAASSMNDMIGHTKEKVDKIKFKNDSYKTNQRSGGRVDKSSINNLYTGEIDNDFGRDDSLTKTLDGGVGSKYMNEYIDRDGNRSDMNDL